MSTYVVQVTARFLVEGASCPEQALAWLNDTSVALDATSVGHRQLVILIDDGQLDALPATRDETAFEASHGSLPLLSQWSPAAWPTRTCARRALNSNQRGTPCPA